MLTIFILIGVVLSNIHIYPICRMCIQNTKQPKIIYQYLPETKMKGSLRNDQNEMYFEAKFKDTADYIGKCEQTIQKGQKLCGIEAGSEDIQKNVPVRVKLLSKEVVVLDSTRGLECYTKDFLKYHSKKKGLFY